MLERLRETVAPPHKEKFFVTPTRLPPPDANVHVQKWRCSAAPLDAADPAAARSEQSRVPRTIGHTRHDLLALRQLFSSEGVRGSQCDCAAGVWN